MVTGGAGFTGINLIRYLLDKGVAVKSVDLEPFEYADCKDRVEHVQGDIRHAATMDRACEGCDLVIHGAMALPLYSEEDILTTGIDGTRQVLAAAVRQGVRRAVHISSTAVYGVPDHHPLVETDPMVGVGPYGKAKIAAEGICDEFRDQGLVVSVIRPKSFIGPERLGVFALLYDWAKDGRGFPMIGNGKNRYQLLDVEDLADAIWLCATLADETVNTVFNIGAGEYTTMGEDWQAVLDHAGFGKQVKGFPAWPLIWTLRALDRLNLSPLYPWVYETAAKDSFVSIDKARQDLGYAPRYSNKDALVRNFEWYVAHLDEFEDASGVSHRVPWKQGALSVAKKFF
ncbi:MAG: NAD-dependent epimerase/dehydratase family protein [bacterium]|nr:NAD-dependent epimerase/dehydratase family protein [bacterium]